MRSRLGGLALATAASRGLGFVKAILLVYAIGGTSASVGGQAFEIANTAPLNLYGLLAGGVLGSILLPQLVAANVGRLADRERLDRLLTVVLVASGGLTVVLTLASPLVVFAYAASWSPSWMGLAAAMTYWCMPQVLFFIIFTIQSQILNSRDVYTLPAWAPVFSNLAAIAGLAIFMLAVPAATGGVEDWTPFRVALLCGSATLSVIVQTVILLPAVRRAGFRFRFRWGLRGLRAAGAVATWTFLGVIAAQAAYLFVSNSASAAGQTLFDRGEDGASLNSLSLAYLLLLVPHAVLTVSLATATFTDITTKASIGDFVTFASEVRNVQIAVLLVTVPASIFFAVAGPRITSLFWGTEVIGQVLQALALVLVGFGQIYVLNRALYALHDGRGVFINQATVAVLTAISALGAALLEPLLVVPAIALATGIANLIGWMVADLRLRRFLHARKEPALPRDTGGALRLLVATAVAVAVLVGIDRLAAGWSSPWALSFVIVIIDGLVSYGVFIGVLALFRDRRLTELVRMLRPAQD